MSPMRAKTTVFILLLLFFVVGIFGVTMERVAALVVMAVLFLAAIIVELVFWRCPDCHMPLPIQGLWGAEFCPYCGKKLK